MISILAKRDISDLENIALKNGKLTIQPASFYGKYSQEQLSCFCVKHAFYQLPTVELMDWIYDQIKNFHSNTIEICAGNGVIGRSLGIRMYDNFMQELPEVEAFYKAISQPTINYGDDVQRIDANEAIEVYKPVNVIGSWVTQRYEKGCGNVYGPKENEILEKVDKYIHIGNENTHFEKIILKQPHKAYHFPWLFSRSMNKNGNVIYVWG